MIMRKHRFVAVALGVTCTAAGVVLGGVLAQATATGRPEIDRASATVAVQGTLVSATCNGEDKVPTTAGTLVRTPYVTYTGSFTGTENQLLPDPTDYSLSGPFTISGISWTINVNPGNSTSPPTPVDRGVLTAHVSLTVAGTTGSVVYGGTMVLITQGLPQGASAPPATGRGWIVANFKQADDGVAPPGDDYLYANVEFPSITLTGATGSFGDDPSTNTPPVVPDFSVVANTPPTGTIHC